MTRETVISLVGALLLLVGGYLWIVTLAPLCEGSPLGCMFAFGFDKLVRWTGFGVTLVGLLLLLLTVGVYRWYRREEGSSDAD